MKILGLDVYEFASDSVLLVKALEVGYLLDIDKATRFRCGPALYFQAVHTGLGYSRHETSADTRFNPAVRCKENDVPDSLFLLHMCWSFER